MIAISGAVGLGKAASPSCSATPPRMACDLAETHKNNDWADLLLDAVRLGSDGILCISREFPR